LPKNKVKLNKSLCKGCGYCIEFCPNKVLEKSDELNEKGVQLPKIAHEEKCISCGLCALLCPDFAITMEAEDDE
jgi:2-oxoglutarate ferredoxin oxidoreductase subunit delta